MKSIILKIVHPWIGGVYIPPLCHRGETQSFNRCGGEKTWENSSDWSASPRGRHRACPGIDVTTPRVANQDWWSIMAALVAGEVVDEEDFLLCAGGWITRLHLAKLKRRGWVLQTCGHNTVDSVLVACGTWACDIAQTVVLVVMFPRIT